MNYNFVLQQFESLNSSPQKLAIAGSDADISWADLKTRVDEISALLKSLSIPPACPVIIYGHKESLYPIVMLACFHAGVTYIPIDSIYPLERIKTIVEKTSAQVLFNCSEAPLELCFPLTVNARLQVSKHGVPDFSRPVYTGNDDVLQYVMFTSGSTGEPKGVQITKSSLLSYLEWTSEAYPFSGDDVFMNQAPFTFDVSLCDVLNAFARGGTLLLTSREHTKSSPTFLHRLKDYKASLWTSTPSFVFMFLREPDFNEENISVKHFLFMGEELPSRTCQQLRQKFPGARIFNAYGPTEATIVTTLIEITDDVLKTHAFLPIGYPKKDSQLIVDKSNPNDREGEIVIVGDHVSIGYLNNAELNKKKFLSINGKRAFRTGDLGYYEGDLLFCLGRNDDQVKLHGYRIELNEISNVLLKKSFIQDACTVALRRNNEVKKIVSFIITSQPAETGELKLFLESHLPYYMIPGDIIALEKFPHSTSHKVDKNKLIEIYMSEMNK